MPWQTSKLSNIEKKARSLIYEFIDIQIDIPVYISTEEEMIEAVLFEQLKLNRKKNEIEKIKYDLNFILGKFFSNKQEIWVVDGRGINLDVIIHELLHSIQKCLSKREHIVDYITFKITKNKEYIDELILKDWLEIEESVGFKKIIKSLVTIGDCEVF